jgi:helicase
VSDADALLHLEEFGVAETPPGLAHIRQRAEDYYLALVGELFDRLRVDYGDSASWARLGNALAQFADGQRWNLLSKGVAPGEATLFAAAAFYLGGFPASAYVTLKERGPIGPAEPHLACFDLLARPGEVRSTTIRTVLEALRSGDMARIEQLGSQAAENEMNARELGPEEWIPARLLHQLLKRFRSTNVRAALPEGQSAFWNPLISSLLDRKPAAWEFFPSQLQALRSGLLQRPETFSLQMPTGSGKTALCETLLYWHLRQNPSAVAILLVPYRSLASELRGTLVRRLTSMGLSAGCAYGGTVPLGDEIRGLDETRALVATPESLSGLLSADPSFLRRVSLVVCDEGHLLDGGSRGVGLELLLARLKGRGSGAPRFVFISAIVPNIEEINIWLGGTVDSVVRSDYRPALVEFGVLMPSASRSPTSVNLKMHPHEPAPVSFTISNFLRRQDFQWVNPQTGRTNTFGFTSVKTQAVAAARKALTIGAVAVFAANKRGNQGAVGLADELLAQLQRPLNLPNPLQFAVSAQVERALEYVELEYGRGWVAAQALKLGAVLHHGDIPQETREVVEALIREGHARLAICTNTLAEGVNLPLRTLVLYSVQRRQKGGGSENLLARDIKNLVGRAGRAGATTKGLVICANQEQWQFVEPVAKRAAGEPVVGALRMLIERLRRALAAQNITLTNVELESTPDLHTLVDGVDATLVDLASEEVGDDELVQIAVQLADQTFASQQSDAETKSLLKEVFSLRARRMAGMRSAGRLGWVKETGARARMVDGVEAGLLPLRESWDNVNDPVDPAVVDAILKWAWTQPDLLEPLRESYRLEDGASIDPVQQRFFDLVHWWLAGSTFSDMAALSNLSVDDLLGVHAKVIAFVLQTLVEQAVALLGKLLESRERLLAPAVMQFPEHLRFGVPTPTARVLSAGGVRHRRAAVALGTTDEMRGLSAEDKLQVFSRAQRLLLEGRQVWRARLGVLVLENTLRDIAAVTEHA